MINSELNILMIIARDRQNEIIFRIAIADLQKARSIAMATAIEVLKDQQAAVRVEVHNFEGTESLYGGKPLAVYSVDDMTNEERKLRIE